jgi:hypothetical protein
MHGLSGHSEPHVFHFFCDSSGTPVIQDKAYHTQAEWSEPYQLLSSIPQGVAHLMIFDGLTAHPITNPSLMALSSTYRPGSELFILDLTIICVL